MAGDISKAILRIEPPECKAIVGGVVKFSIFLDKPITSANITIYSPTAVLSVDSINMTKVTNNVYEYFYQTTSTYLYGIYYVSINIINGDYTTLIQDTFELLEQEP